MPPAMKKRKVTAVANKASNAPTFQNIQAFGTISKSQVDPHRLGKSKLDQENYSNLQLGSLIVDGSSKKRKLDLLPESALIKTSNKVRVLSTGAQGHGKGDGWVTSTEGPTLSASLPSVPIKPVTRRKKATLRLTTADTPTKGARTCLQSFVLPSPSSLTSNSSPPSKSSEIPPSSPLPAHSPSSVPNDSLELPDELQDLINLHSSFLTALSLHYAHHGSLTPADLRTLRPGIERSWRKRRVSLEDVRRLLAIQKRLDPHDHKPSLPRTPGVLSLSDYGSGKICIEIADNPKHQGLQRRLLDEETLNTRFSKTLAQQWTLFTTTHPAPLDSKSFISTLPLAPIILCASLSKTAHLLAKGQIHLSDLKAGAIRAQQRSNISTTTPPANDPSLSATKPPTTSRASNLLTRVLAKQLHQSTLPALPSAEALARKCALQRLQEILPVIDILTASTARSTPDSQPAEEDSDKNAETQPEPNSLQTISFTMPTLVQHLQMSLRNPISKEEAVRCVRGLAEVVPEWVGVREVGKVVGVVVRRGRGVGRAEVGKRVGVALGGL